MATKDLKKEIQEIKENICLVSKGKHPKSSFARNVLVKEGYLKFKKGNKLGEGNYLLTDKGKRIKKIFKC